MKQNNYSFINCEVETVIRMSLSQLCENEAFLGKEWSEVYLEGEN